MVCDRHVRNYSNMLSLIWSMYLLWSPPDWVILSFEKSTPGSLKQLRHLNLWLLAKRNATLP
jgi:hypothetical protein